MGQSLVQIYVHIVFSTKGRKPLLKSDAHRERLYAFLSGICKNQNSPATVSRDALRDPGLCC